VSRARATYLTTGKALKNNTAGAELQRFNSMLVLFRKYGNKYGFDPLMLAAQGFQESGLKQDARSHVGAIGVMQLMPATGQEMRVGDIGVTEANIHAASKYMDPLMSKYFADAAFDEQQRALFAFAAYNAGPGRIAQMRKAAAADGLNPNVWFNNVELVVEKRVGMEPVQYVRNIYKYFVAYRLELEHEVRREQAIQKTKRESQSSH
jgi:membrane-bound lytic murein transglycosylase MltF